jgi:hypothetical protein
MSRQRWHPGLRYYVGGGYEENQGAEPVNRLHRTNLRVNLSANAERQVGCAGEPWGTPPGARTCRSRRAAAVPCGARSSPPRASCTRRAQHPGNPQLGFRSGPPNAYYQAYNNFQDADRFTGSVTLTNRPTSWFNHRLILGVDRLAENNQALTPRNDPLAARYAAFAGSGLPTAARWPPPRAT